MIFAHVTSRLTLLLFVAFIIQSQASVAQSAPPPQSPSTPLGPSWEGKAYSTSWDLYQAMKVKSHSKPAVLPNWSGVWTRKIDGAFMAFGAHQPPNPKLASPMYGLPIGAKLTPEYQAAYDKKITGITKGVEWDQLSACLPAGFPRWLMEPFLREFIVRPEETWLITEQQSEVRRIYTDGSAHVPDDEAYPLWEGDSIGFWDGDTLVIHTNNLKPGQYMRGQPDYSDKTTTVERMRKTGANSVSDEVWVYDPASLLEPWHVVVNYERVVPPLRINMWSCNENNNVVKTPDGSSTFILPGEKGYQDPNKLGKP